MKKSTRLLTAAVQAESRAAGSAENFAKRLHSPEGQALSDALDAATDLDSIRGLFIAATGLNPDDYSSARSYREIAERHSAAVAEHTRGAVTSDAFAYLMGKLSANNLSVAGMRTDTPLYDRIFRRLPSVQDVERHAYANEGEMPVAIGESEEYPTAQTGEKYVDTRGYKYGRRYDITMETVKRDNTGAVLRAINSYSENVFVKREQLCAAGLSDSGYAHKGSTWYSYYPAGARAALYRTADAGTAQTYAVNAKTTNALADFTDVQNLRTIIRAITIASGKDQRISHVGMPALIAPLTLEDAAVKALLYKEIRDNSAAANQVVWDGPQWIMGTDIVLSWALDDLSTSTWFYGYPASGQFVWHEVRAPFAEMADYNDRSITNDVVSAIKFGFHGGPNAVDDRHFVKSTA